MRQRIGILGGSFNPIHWGHLILAEQARQILNLDKIVFVPANIPVHKKAIYLAPPKDRYQMVCLAIRPNPHFSVSDLEIKRKGPSYSIDTLKQLKQILPGARLYFIVGSDFLGQYRSWKRINELKRICRIIVAKRPGYRLRALPKAMQSITISELDISSSQVRQRIKSGHSVRYLVPEAVLKYILKKGLYRAKIKQVQSFGANRR